MTTNIYSLQHEIIEQSRECEDHRYTGYGIIAKLIDQEDTTMVTIEDITYNIDMAQSLLQQVVAHRVTPLCLTMFIENYLFDTEYATGI